MNLPGTTTLKHVASFLRKQFEPRAVILMYHSVAEVSSDPWGLRVRPDHFAEQLRILRDHAQPISLQQLVQAHQTGHIPDRAVVVTFDDGYVDNLRHAKPLLEQYKIPATVFLASGYIGGECEFWWDELDRLLLQPGTLPPTLCLKIEGHAHQWDLGEAVHYNLDDYRRDRYRRAWESKSGSRLALYYSLWQLLRLLRHDQRQQLLAEIRLWAGIEPDIRSTHRPLSWKEVEILGQGELVEIGAHTVTHPFLSAHSAALQEEEIRQSKVKLEEMLHCPVLSFSYPHGDYNEETLSLIEEAGFNCACTVVAESAWRISQRLELPRFDVKDWSGEEFTKWFRYRVHYS